MPKIDFWKTDFILNNTQKNRFWSQKEHLKQKKRYDKRGTLTVFYCYALRFNTV